jgi:putative ATP-dependent endonuclease of OLD family
VQQAEKGIREATVLLQLRRVLSPTIAEMFFAPRLVLVESDEDVAYIATYMRLSGRWDKFRQHGTHIIPVGRKSDMLRPLAIANQMKIPVFVVFDGDVNCKPEHKQLHEVDNRRLLNLLGQPDQTPIPTDTIWNERFVMWRDVIGSSVRADFEHGDWHAAGEAAQVLLDHPANAQKNPMFVAARLKTLFESGRFSASLEKLCASIMTL